MLIILLSLFLDFGTSGDTGLAGIVWLATFVLWLPQILVIWLVTKYRKEVQQSLISKPLLLLIPLALFLKAVVSAPAIFLLLVAYSDIQWSLWLFILLLPTIMGIIKITIDNYIDKNSQKTHPLPKASYSSFRLRLVHGIIGLSIIGALALIIQKNQSRSPEKTSHYLPWLDNAEELQAEQARRDSILFMEKWGEKKVYNKW
ncbi:hypothetical protein [Hymenobacter guriensis]|uniref:MFS transporter n=1 Tax=Hymenobacter guriensis TaxID=2793065 RepID=A0ABS0L8J1_9BACT|nr:hypothetical protein [Hymenobacter guriensis]MBG8556386.1 hypothetical protein [Hymenobacter guriensis]